MASAIRLRGILTFLQFYVIKLNIIPTTQKMARERGGVVTDTFEIRQTQGCLVSFFRGKYQTFSQRSFSKLLKIILEII